MNKTAIIIIVFVGVIIGVLIYSNAKGQPFISVPPGTPDSGPNNTGKTVANQNASTLAQIASGAGVLKKLASNIGALVGNSLSDKVSDVGLSKLTEYAAQQAENVLTAGGTVEQAAAKSMQAASTHLAEQAAAAAGTTGATTATTGTTGATVAGSGALVGVSAAAAALAIVAWVAYAWGVFDPYDPNAGTQLFTLNKDVDWIKAKAGQQVRIPNAIFDMVTGAQSSEEADQILQSYFYKMGLDIEAKQAAADAQQRAWAAEDAAATEAARLAEIQRQALGDYQNAQSLKDQQEAQARLIAANQQAEQQAAAALAAQIQAQQTKVTTSKGGVQKN